MKIVLAAAILMASCGNNQSGEKNEKISSDSAVVKGSSTSTSATTRNGIELTPVSLKVEQAFLLFEDGRLVPEDNKVELGQKVQLRLIVEDWKPVDGKVFIGASEKIETNTGQVVLDEQDLFAHLSDGVDPNDAKTITLSAVINRIDRLYDYFVVSFRVWDKKSGDEVYGSYKLYLK